MGKDPELANQANHPDFDLCLLNQSTTPWNSPQTILEGILDHIDASEAVCSKKMAQVAEI